MEKLFTIEGSGELTFSEYALGIDAFYTLWKRDSSDKKERAVKDLSFCYFMGSVGSRNPYREYEKQEKLDAVIRDVYGEQEFAIDEDIHNALKKFVEEDKTVAKEFLRTAINSSYKLKDFLEDIDLNERDSNGRLIHNSKQYKDALESMADTLKKINELRKMVKEEEMEDDAKIRGGGKKEYF